MTGIHVVTNRVPRFTIDAWDLSPAERQRFDYVDWPAVEQGRDSATFVRYLGELYDLHEFEWVDPLRQPNLAGWSRYLTDSAFSATLLRWVDDECESVVMGRCWW